LVRDDDDDDDDDEIMIVVHDSEMVNIEREFNCVVGVNRDVC